MTDLTMTIAPKSDQLNADDLIGRSRTISITRVSLLSEADQPIAINFDGDGGKPYKPCKSMRRVLVTMWGGDGNAYVGRAMTLYRDDKVQFGGMAVGGIRISHMSDIPRETTIALTATRAKRAPYTVKPLTKPDESGGGIDAETMFAAGVEAVARGTDALKTFWTGLSPAIKSAVGGQKQLEKWKEQAAQADASRASSKPAPDWLHELETYSGDLGEHEHLERLESVITEQGARFDDAPADVQAEARQIEDRERARVKGGGK